MAGRAVLITTILAMLTGCGQIERSAVNPFNWFGQQEEVPATAPAQAGVFDPRPVVSQVTSISVEPMPGGAILRAVGLPPRQGYWNAELVEVDGNNPNVLTYRFRVAPPPEPTRVSTQVSREVVVATFISDQTLARTRQIQVLGAQNSRAVRR